jgi:hypothetical protein
MQPSSLIEGLVNKDKCRVETRIPIWNIVFGAVLVFVIIFDAISALIILKKG